MTDLAIPPGTYRIQRGTMSGRIAAPPSKSFSHRALIISALAGGGSVNAALVAEDISVTLTALKSMSYEFESQAGSIVFSQRSELLKPAQIDAGESGTSARFLTALAALESQPINIHGRGRLHRRPFEPLLKVLRTLGADCQSQRGLPPLTIQGPLTRGGNVEVSAAKSSQFVSALMLIAPYLQKGLHINLKGPVHSRPYIDITAVCMRKAGIDVEVGIREIKVSPGRYQPANYRIEGDWSNVSYWLVGAAISGGELQISNLRSDSVQGDRAIVNILQSCGADFSWHEHELKQELLVLHRCSRLKAFRADIAATPDLAPSLAVLALFCEGTTVLENVAILRHKESDRLEAILHNLQALGAIATSDGRSLTICPPAQLHAARLRTFGDHRIAMSFALAGLCIEGVELDDASVVGKSYPQFWQDFKQLFNAVEAG